jgi:hypothetical protein
MSSDRSSGGVSGETPADGGAGCRDESGRVVLSWPDQSTGIDARMNSIRLVTMSRWGSG